MSSDAKKILLIGAKGYDRDKKGLRLKCVAWDKLSSIRNVRDYDVLVINLLSIKTTAERNKVDWNVFRVCLNNHFSGLALRFSGLLHDAWRIVTR